MTNWLQNSPKRMAALRREGGITFGQGRFPREYNQNISEREIDRDRISKNPSLIARSKRRRH